MKFDFLEGTNVNNTCSTEYHKFFLLMMNLDIFRLKLNCCMVSCLTERLYQLK